MRRVLALLVPLLLAAGLVAVGATPATAAEQCRRTLAAYPVLVPEDRGPAVRTLQCSLNDVGVGPVVVDGHYGPQTRAAVREVVDGFEGEPARPFRINNGFWTLLFGRQLPERDLERGDRGRAVTVLQRALRAAGATVVVDGDFGAQTERAVRRYQRAVGTQRTGVVDADTRFLLGMGGVIGGLS